MVVETLMQPLLIIEPEISLDSRSRLRYRFVVLQIHLLVLERSPQPLDEDVVPAASATIHANSDVPRRSFARELLTGELHPLVAVEDFRPSPSQGRRTNIHLHRQRQRPAQHKPAKPVHHRHQIDEALGHADLGDIGTPHLLGAVYGYSSQQVGVDLVPFSRLAPLRLRVHRLDSHDCP